MKNNLILSGILASVAGVCLVMAQDTPIRPKVRTMPKGAAASPEKTVPEKTAPARVASTDGHKDLAAGGPVQELGAKIVKAFNRSDAVGFAAAFTADGEYTDENGDSFHGRRAIEAEFKALFAAHTGMKIQLHFESPRVIAPGVAAADGQTRFTHGAGNEPVIGKCSIVCAREGEEWLIASLREGEAPVHHATHREQVGQLDWLMGDWIDESSAYHVHFTCRWDESGNYLLRDFSVHIAGEKASSGTQRIGYDALSGHLKAWVFDPSGGFSDGYFHRDGDRWILHLSGVTADGQMASGTNIFTRVDEHRMQWQALDCIVGGEPIADTGIITIVRKPPAPAPRSH